MSLPSRWRTIGLSLVAGLGAALAFPPFGVLPGLLGYALLRQDKAEQALQELSMAMKQGPATATLHCIQGRCLEKLGRHNEAVDCYVLALRTEPANGLAKALLASSDAKPAPGAP